MKIAIIGQKGIPSRKGGVEIHVEEIGSRLASKHKITVYCRKEYCSNLYTDYKGMSLIYIKSINTKNLDAISYTFLSTVHALIMGNDLIHYHALGPSLLAFIPRIFGRKVVCTFHGLDYDRDKWGKVAKIMLKIGEYIGVKFSHKQIVVAQNLVEIYKKKYDKNLIYIPNGVEKKEKIEPNLIRIKYGIEKDSYILFLARLVPEKGLHYLINAFNSIETEKKLVIAGGASHSDEYVKYIKDLARNNKNIIFTDFVENQMLDELFYNAYFYILPSDIEGLPISLLEAMAYGQCCLVSDIKENVEVVNNYAEKFKAKNQIDLANKIKYLINNEIVVQSYKRQAENYILNKYNWESVASETEKVYTSLIN